MRSFILTAAALGCFATAAAQTRTPANEMPAHLVPQSKSWDYERRDVMIPMRDGVKLHTVIILPKRASHAPILLTRTPYNADELTTYGNSGREIGALDGYDNADDVIVQAGYIRVVQDVRGKYKSQGEYVMNRPPVGPLNNSGVDDITDCYDTIDWLVHNVPETNKRVGTIGISYDGWTTLMSMFHPHPALKVAVPMNPMVDGWMGDDWFHRGAFRQLGSLNYIYEQEGTPDNKEKWWTDHYDDYDAFLELGSAGAMADSHGENQVGFYNRLTEHPAYDDWWRRKGCMCRR
jgi:putative CocE/NonD family hydrolase